MLAAQRKRRAAGAPAGDRRDPGLVRAVALRGQLSGRRPVESMVGPHLPVKKRFVAELRPEWYPESPIVPSMRPIHARAQIEIVRGCTRGCRFCQAGMVTRPVRERSAAEIKTLSAAALGNTGYSEISLLSLSSSDHSQIEEIVGNAAQEFCAEGVSVALPSLRIESFSVGLADSIKEGKKSGFTFAPEAATERLRNVINKVIPDERLLATADAVYSRGWRTIKLYFMIGLPTETDEDVVAICNLAKRVLHVGRKYHGKGASVHVGVSTFVPKPHTPFQWVGQESRVGDRAAPGHSASRIADAWSEDKLERLRFERSGSSALAWRPADWERDPASLGTGRAIRRLAGVLSPRFMDVGTR